MKKVMFAGLCLAAAASAQTKISGTGKCGKPDKEQAIEVGDRAGHIIAMAQESCTWTAPFEMAGIKAKSYTGTIVSDISGAKSSDRGYVVVNMENGDKAIVRINQGTSRIGKEGKPESGEGTWTYVGGTGKFNGLTGKGTYKSKAAGDSMEDQIEGEYTLAAGKS